MSLNPSTPELGQAQQSLADAVIRAVTYAVSRKGDTLQLDVAAATELREAVRASAGAERELILVVLEQLALGFAGANHRVLAKSVLALGSPLS